MTAKLTPPLKWHGGKQYLAKRIVELMPPHVHFVEAYAGGMAVLLAKNPEGVSEVVNDLNGDLMNFWRVLQNVGDFERFHRHIMATPFSEVEWHEGQEELQRRTDADPVQRAVWFFIACRQSLAGRMDTFAPLSRNRTRRGMNEQASAWLSAVEGLPSVHKRLCRVSILKGPALDVIQSQDAPGTLFYLDPPYLPRTRAACDVYAHEMTEREHRLLLDLLCQVEGKVLLSGYPSETYDTALAGWTRHAFDLPNNAAGGTSKARETEVVWCNY